MDAIKLIFLRLDKQFGGSYKTLFIRARVRVWLGCGGSRVLVGRAALDDDSSPPSVDDDSSPPSVSLLVTSAHAAAELVSTNHSGYCLPNTFAHRRSPDH